MDNVKREAAPVQLELDLDMFGEDFAPNTKVTVYSRPNCIKCKMLKEVLEQKGIPFKEVSSMEELQAKGLMSVPAVEFDGLLMLYTDAMEWANEQ